MDNPWAQHMDLGLAFVGSIRYSQITDRGIKPFKYFCPVSDFVRPATEFPTPQGIKIIYGYTSQQGFKTSLEGKGTK